MTSVESEQPSSSKSRVVSDTGPLISLEKLTGGFRFIRRLYDRIIVPPAVLEEVGFHEARAKEYLERHDIADLVEVQDVVSQTELPDIERLHEGEIQAIRLAMALELPLFIEEAGDGAPHARSVFRYRGLRVRSSEGIAATFYRWRRRVLCWENW